MDLNDRRQLPLFSIGTVQKLTGLSARQIRYYEEHELIQPARTAGKQRQFSFADVERLMLIREWLDEGHNMAGVKRNFAEMESRKARNKSMTKSEPSDTEVYKWLEREMLHNRSQTESHFQGDLSRFYRKR
ncbi:MerR family transcriptional regulator [Alicyclobacillus dauci]|uniref:MerR family transcriptional regulator n=1 Tax=Alicyclobacillus dauci TaxID=1475485 RepID=A0ABY6YXH0_9BACL|nr:MerR family transcriptional regulator [Alicyclobacillus dauci]WAH35310.1 MerR family transcriptional regulator [Alicyclobacillus dauci]